TEKVTFSDGSFAYTTVTKIASYAGIDAAMAAANGKNLATYADVARGATIPGPPSVSGRTVGDTHRIRYTDNGEIAKEFTLRAGTPNSWQEVKYGDAVLTSLDVGKLTAGAGVFDEIVADFMAGEMAAFVKAAIDTLIVTGELTVDSQVAQAIWAAKVAARKVLAGEVIIGGEWNLNTDPTFTVGWSGNVDTPTTDGGATGGPSARIPSGAINRFARLG